MIHVGLFVKFRFVEWGARLGTLGTLGDDAHLSPKSENVDQLLRDAKQLHMPEEDLSVFRNYLVTLLCWLLQRKHIKKIILLLLK